MQKKTLHINLKQSLPPARNVFGGSVKRVTLGKHSFLPASGESPDALSVCVKKSTHEWKNDTLPKQKKSNLNRMLEVGRNEEESLEPITCYVYGD